MEKEKAVKSRFAIASFVLSIVPILLIILYGFIRNFLISYLYPMILYGYLVSYLPYICLIFSVIAIILVRRRKMKGMGFAIAGLIISLLEIVIFFMITPK